MANVNSALFIDYDNVRSELDRYDPAVAARFSNKPLLWLEAMSKHLQLPDGAAAEGRTIVSRRCYASPYRIEGYRRNFTQTGFEVVDCPPLTAHLKNSADIYIVMDIVDYLQRYPHIDEYIILSADADFVPVLNRLRKELKKSVIFTSYNTTAAYRNCADRTIEADFFATHLAIETAVPRPFAEAAAGTPSAPPASAPLDPDLAADISRCLSSAAARRFGKLPFATAAQAVRAELGDRLGMNWAGRGTFSALLDQVELDGLEVHAGAQMLIHPDFKVELTGWSEEDRNRLAEFVDHVAKTATKTIPLLPPREYSALFGALAARFQEYSEGTFTEAIEAVAQACRAGGVDVTAQDVRFIATGISMQQYRFEEAADARRLAALWRAQVFYLCKEPDWMREPEEAELLAAWMHGPDETVEEARDDFIARTADEPAEAAASMA